MVRERVVQKKSFQQSLDDIKEKMKEKRNQRLANASASAATTVKPFVLKSVQVNNKALALALQAEREKVRQAQGIILQMKRERQALIFHLLMLKRALREAGALKPAQVSFYYKYCFFAIVKSSIYIEKNWCQIEKQQYFSSGSQDGPASLPATVGMRRRRDGKKRSERLRRRSSLFDPASVGGTVTEEVEPPSSDMMEGLSEQDPELKLDVAPRSKPERGRKPDRAPLKKPWENTKPRARSKSRDRSRTRAQTAPVPSDRLNSSLGGNDTFDFDCEEAVHITPFRAGSKASENQPEKAPPSPIAPPSPVTMEVESSPSEPEKEADDSLYVPEKKLRRARSPPPRRARSKRRSTQRKGKENAPPKKPRTTSENTAPSPELDTASPLPVNPAEEAELMIDSPFFELATCPSQSSEQENNMPDVMNKPKRRKGGLVVRSCLGLALSDVTNLSPAAYQKPLPGRDSTPAAGRRRRCSSSVNYKEPSISSKLRRGDKFTDTQFLRSPIFKQKSRRSLKTMEKYNESFVGLPLI
uniref:Shugoshin 1 n=1 Tax=Astyanax mexicanus TaxID=7994 RepID=A0A3B1JZ06_ASTMX